MPVSRSVASWCLVCVLAAAAGLTAHAQPTSRTAVATGEGRTWSSLSSTQQKALAPLKADWSTIDPNRRIKWIELADRMPSMSDAERERVRDRMADWAALSPTQRGQARMNYKEAQRLPAEDRRARWEAYKSLPADQQQALAARAAPASSPAARRPRRDEPQPKTTLVPRSAYDARPAVVAPSLAQAQPGATTNLVTKRPAPPAHQQPGLPKIQTGSSFVDSRTLLPKRGAQAAATRTAAAASAPVLDRP